MTLDLRVLRRVLLFRWAWQASANRLACPSGVGGSALTACLFTLVTFAEAPGPEGRNGPVSKGNCKGKGQFLARQKPSLKPLDECAIPTEVAVKHCKCEAFNWTTQHVCWSCETGCLGQSTRYLHLCHSECASIQAPGTMRGRSSAQGGASAGSQAVLP